MVREGGVGILKVGKVHHAIDIRQNDAHGCEAGPNYEILDEISVHTKLPIMVALDPRQAIGNLLPAFVEGIKRAEIVSEGKCVRYVQIGLSRDCREIVLAPSVLYQERIHQIRFQDRVD